MAPYILENIPAILNPESIAGHLRVEAGKRYYKVIEEIVGNAQKIARPKGLYLAAFKTPVGDDLVVIGESSFESRVLKVNLENIHRVFPFVATCGKELDQWSKSFNGPFEGFALNAIKSFVLQSAVNYIDRHIEKNFKTAKLSRMTPGSLKDWPITEQRQLFNVLGDVESAIGVRLMDSMMMSPEQSVSGIIFPTDNKFESCQLCPKEKCPSRRADFEEDLFEKKYKRKKY